MTDERLFERLATHGGPADVDPDFDDRLYAFLQQEMRRPERSARPVLLLVAALLLALALGGAVLVGSGIVELPVLPVLPNSSATHLAYGLDGAIYLADWDGQNPVRIADGEPDASGCGEFGGEGPMWSPDGRHLAYRGAWGDVCEGTVYISDAEGHAVASFPGTGWLISWSPDSTRVATWVELWQTIGIYGLDGIRQALIPLPSECASSGDWDPVWSPDSSSSVMASACEVPIDGGAPRRLPPDNPRRFTWYPAYTPDGSRVAFVRGFGGDSLSIAEADGTELRVREGGFYQDPVLSPTGDRVAFLWSSGLTWDQEGNPAPNTHELRVVDVASGTVTSLASQYGIFPFNLIRFSSDGERILFARLDDNYVGTGLWSVNADGSDTQLLVTGTGWGDWQPLPGR